MASSSLHEPVHIPDWAWQRPETRDTLAARDVGGLFRLAQRYAGASQARIASAVGISQGRVNEHIHGKRGAATLDLFLRVADGLHLPDDARIAMGLAPRRPDPAGGGVVSGEISRVYPNQAPVADEIRQRAHDADELDVLAVRGLGILGLNDSLLRPALAGRSTPLRVRVLLLDPACPAAERRAHEIGEQVDSFAAGIRYAVARLREVAHANGVLDVTLRLYTRLPVWRMIRLDEVLYLSAFDAAWEGHESVVYRIPRTERGAFWHGHRRDYTELWDTATPTGDAA